VGQGHRKVHVFRKSLRRVSRGAWRGRFLPGLREMTEPLTLPSRSPFRISRPFGVERY
jgi:hypothetical protein